MFEFLDSLDIEHPYFYAAPCTRCLKCGHPLFPAFQKGNISYWYCDFFCHQWVDVGLGSRNQITRSIRWTERYEKSKKRGTPSHVEGIPAPTGIFEIDYEDDGLVSEMGELYGEPSTILTPPVARLECWTFTTLLCVVVTFRRMGGPIDITLNRQPLTYHEIMHVYSEASQLSLKP